MRTFHICGTGNRDFGQSRLDAKATVFTRFITLDRQVEGRRSVGDEPRRDRLPFSTKKAATQRALLGRVGAKIRSHGDACDAWPGDGGVDRTRSRPEPSRRNRAIQDFQEGVTRTRNDEVTGHFAHVVTDSLG